MQSIMLESLGVRSRWTMDVNVRKEAALMSCNNNFFEGSSIKCNSWQSL